MHLPLLGDMLILLIFSVVIVLALQKLKLPSILGFLVTGIIIGPYGFSLVNAVDEVEVIAEIGVILLLFVIGMELSIKQLASIKKTVFFGGFLQVGITAGVAGLSYFFLGNDWNAAVFVGFLFSLSSTAIVLKLLQERNEMGTPHGRNALGILIFQDIIVVPMMLVTPILAGQTENVGYSVLMLVVKSLIVVAITIVSARYLVPKLMHVIAKTRSKELFLLTTITLCFAVAFITSEAGLSLALGAFLAGLIISESEYSHQATSIILPFRELFTSFFFISVGMLMDVDFFLTNTLVIVGIVVLVFIFKGLIASLAVALLKYPPRTVILTGLALFQVGEFAFILSKVGIENNLLSPEMNQYFLSVSIVSMLITPFIMMGSERITDYLLSTRWVKILSRGATSRPIPVNETTDEELENHLVIIGYGVNGSNLAKAARYSNIPYVVIELNAQTVQTERKKNIPIIFGDAAQDHMLDAVNLNKARAVVIAISDPQATKSIISNIRSSSQSIYLVVRTRYVKETSELLALGADEVIPEEFETSVEIFSRVLHNFLIPSDDINRFIEEVRSNNYGVFQAQKKVPKTMQHHQIPNFKMTCVRVNKDSGTLIGKTIRDSDVRTRFGVNIVAIGRNEDMILHVSPEEKILQNDQVYVNGPSEAIEDFLKAIN